METQPSLFAALWRFKWLIAGVAILAAVVGYGVSSMSAPTYQSNGLVLLNDPRTSGEQNVEFSLFFDPTRYIRNQVTVIQSPAVLERAYEIMLEFGYESDEIVVNVSARVVEDRDAMGVTSTGGDAQQTTDMVNSTVQAYSEVISGQVQVAADREIEKLNTAKDGVAAEIAALETQLEDDPGSTVIAAELSSSTEQLIEIDTRIKTLETAALLYGSGIQLFIGPQGPGQKTAPKPARNAAIALVLGAIAAGAFAWWRAEQDQRADSKEAAASVLDAPLLATVPDYSSVKAWAPAPTISHPESPASEAYHFALSSVSFVLADLDGNSILITSVNPNEGKTVTALNLAVAAMRGGRKPLLIDGDERMRGLTKLAGVDPNGGTEAPIGQEVNWAVTADESIGFVAAGRDLGNDISGYFRSVPFRRGLQKAIADHDLVIIDGPPVMAASETAELAAEVDGVVLVVEMGTALRQLADARDRIEMSGTPIIGYIFNKAEASAAGYYSYSEPSDDKTKT